MFSPYLYLIRAGGGIKDGGTPNHDRKQGNFPGIRVSLCSSMANFRMGKNVRDLFDLTGRTAIVTGGSRGIGKEMALGLAEAGANLMLCARRAEWLNETVNEFKDARL